MLPRLGFGLALLLAGPALGQALQDPPQQPILRIETGAHTAPVARLATDAAGRLLASASDDKTLRLWSLPDGTPRGVLRPPIGEAEEGELYAVALSPDGSRAFAAGNTCRAWDGSFCIYVFDTGTGRLAARLPGLPAPVQHLAISPDGTRLAAALGGRAGIRVWDARTGRAVFDDTAYAGPARMVAFDREGRLASSSADGKLRLYDARGRKLAERAPLANARPFGIALSPDGTLLAVGYEDRLRVEILALPDLRSVAVPDASGLQGEGLPAVAWASDGRGGVQLHAAGYARGEPSAPGRAAGGASVATQPGGGTPAGGRGIRPPAPEPAVPAAAAPPQARPADSATPRRFVIRRWADFGLGPATDIGAARDSIAQLLPLPQGGLAFAAADPGWGRLAPDGRLALAPRSGTAEFRATGDSLALSADGIRLRVVPRPGLPALSFDVARGELRPTKPMENDGLRPASDSEGGISLTQWRNSTQPRLNGRPLALGQGEFARSAAVLPGGLGFVLGTDTHLRLFDARGNPLDAVTGPGASWGLALSGDGSLLVAAHADGTLRWYGLAENRITERAALFIQPDTQRWALWTPEGLFDHAPSGGQELVGVHLNEGRAATPEWASFQQAYRALYAPQAVRARIGGVLPQASRLADLRARIGHTPLARPGEICAVMPDGTCPVLSWTEASLPAEATALRFSVLPQDRGLGLGPLDVLLNGRIAARIDAPRSSGEARGDAPFQAEIPLDPGPNTIATRLYAADRGLFSEGPGLELRREGQAAPPPGAGRLVILAVGVNNYGVPDMDLRFAVPDARTVVDTLRAGSVGLFEGVDTTLLLDGDATREGILRALDDAARRVRPEDTFVFYIAGHGVRVEENGRFLFLPADIGRPRSMTEAARRALDDDAMISALARIRARDGFLLIDTCYAGQVALDSLSALGNETGRYLLAASSSVQEALDSYDDRNGVFAYALREGLAGRAAKDSDGRISALALGEYVSRRVPELASEKQHRQNAVFRTATRDLRSFPLGIAPR
ncbi:caspase family protein [Pseudoroseomonas cervicalis]|uniref:caspase family protein n=1 Tax=Teichococcus cervicalis TaxID=204525 RepID=UPI0022F15AB0|nr:caspase family protein [Pseudoroseomonas cervicalis]WBV44892.1 caspase family protein [Pseudoroseomonas cervicalis]